MVAWSLTPTARSILLDLTLALLATLLVSKKRDVGGCECVAVGVSRCESGKVIMAWSLTPMAHSILLALTLARPSFYSTSIQKEGCVWLWGVGGGCGEAGVSRCESGKLLWWLAVARCMLHCALRVACCACCACCVHCALCVVSVVRCVRCTLCVVRCALSAFVCYIIN
jgi:hypothetical protein